MSSRWTNAPHRHRRAARGHEPGQLVARRATSCGNHHIGPGFEVGGGQGERRRAGALRGAVVVRCQPRDHRAEDVRCRTAAMPGCSAAYRRARVDFPMPGRSVEQDQPRRGHYWLRARTGGEAVEKLVDVPAGDLAAGLPAGDDADEPIGVEQAEVHLGDGPDGRGPRNLAQQGDLADQVAGADGRDRTSVAEHIGAAHARSRSSRRRRRPAGTRPRPPGRAAGWSPAANCSSAGRGSGSKTVTVRSRSRSSSRASIVSSSRRRGNQQISTRAGPIAPTRAIASRRSVDGRQSGGQRRTRRRRTAHRRSRAARRRGPAPARARAGR